MRTYRHESSNPKWDAQRNLSGLTHYVEDATLRWHKARVLATKVVDNGLLFALIESVALDMNNTKRGFRPVIFDIFGNVIDKVKLADSYKTRKQAEKALWETLNKLDAVAVTLEAIDRHERNSKREMDELRANIAKIAALGKVA